MEEFVLIADDFHANLIQYFKDNNIQYIYEPKITRDEIKLHLKNGVTALFIRSKTNADADLLQDAVKLKMISRGGVGLETIDKELCKKKGIHLYTSNAANSNAVAEHSLGLLLNGLRNISKSNEEINNFQWNREPNRGRELNSFIYGIIGYGNTGSAFSKKLNALGCKVFAYDKYVKNIAGAEWLELRDLLQVADIISLHIPLTKETEKMVDENFMQQWKNPYFLINTSRGEVVKISAVINALQKKELSYFASDVLENEKLLELTETQKMELQFLQSQYNVLLTPHIAGWTVESYEAIGAEMIRNWVEYLCSSRLK